MNLSSCYCNLERVKNSIYRQLGRCTANIKQYLLILPLYYYFLEALILKNLFFSGELYW